jgi:raffinose/stachyose/melibiose transport system permease protein
MRSLETQQTSLRLDYRRVRIDRLRAPAARLSGTVTAALLSLAVLVPFSWVVSTALKSRRDLAFNPLGLPSEWLWQNFSNAWTQGHFSQFFLNSVLVAIPTVTLVLVLSTLAAYAFSQMKFRGKNLFFVLFLVGLMIPLSILIIPLYYELLSLGLLNTHWALILPQVAQTIPFGILLLRSFMDDFPHEILDAAEIDGCTTLDLLWRIVIPISTPALTSLLIFTFMWNWNHFLTAVIFIQKESLRTLPVGLMYFQQRYISDIPLMMAGALITVVPVVLIYAIFQRQFIKGMTAGALK